MKTFKKIALDYSFNKTNLEEKNKIIKPASKINEAELIPPARFLNELGFKIKAENYTKDGFEIVFYRKKDVSEAYEELINGDYLEKYKFQKNALIISFTE